MYTDGINEILAELRIRDKQAKLLKDLDKIRSVEKEWLAVRKNYARIWHSVKDPIVKKQLHEGLNELESVIYLKLTEPKNNILNELRIIDILLEKPENYICNYDSDLDYDDIFKNGIKGLKL